MRGSKGRFWLMAWCRASPCDAGDASFLAVNCPFFFLRRLLDLDILGSLVAGSTVSAVSTGSGETMLWVSGFAKVKTDGGSVLFTHSLSCVLMDGPAEDLKRSNSALCINVR